MESLNFIRKKNPDSQRGLARPPTSLVTNELKQSTFLFHRSCQHHARRRLSPAIAPSYPLPTAVTGHRIILYTAFKENGGSLPRAMLLYPLCQIRSHTLTGFIINPSLCKGFDNIRHDKSEKYGLGLGGGGKSQTDIAARRRQKEPRHARPAPGMNEEHGMFFNVR